MCSLEGGYGSEGSEKEEYSTFPRCVNLDAQEQWSGLAYSEDKPFSSPGA